jgi:F0F1-type ATP synthase delta subunit
MVKMHSIYYLNYASVLLEIARQQNKMSKYEKDVQTLLDTFHRNKNFQEFIVNTSIPSVYRKKAFLDIFQKKFDKKFIYFI